MFQRGALVQREAESFAEMGDFDNGVHSDSANRGVSLWKTANPRMKTATVIAIGMYASGPISEAIDGILSGSTRTCRRSVMICAIGLRPAKSASLMEWARMISKGKTTAEP